MTKDDFLEKLRYQVVGLESPSGYARGYVFSCSADEAWLISNSHLYPQSDSAAGSLALRINTESAWRQLKTLWLRPSQPGPYPDFMLVKIPWSNQVTLAPVDFFEQEVSMWEGYVLLEDANVWHTLQRVQGYASGQLGFVLEDQIPLKSAPLGWSGSPVFKIRCLASGSWTQQVVGTIAYYDPAQSALVAVALQPELEHIRKAMLCYDRSQYALDHTDKDALLAEYEHACTAYQAGNSQETYTYASDWVPLQRLKPKKQEKGSLGIIAYEESNMIRCRKYCKERSFISKSAPRTVDEMMDQVKELFTQVRDAGLITFTRDKIGKAVRSFITTFLRVDMHLNYEDIRFEIQDNYHNRAKSQGQSLSRVFACVTGEPPQGQKEWLEDTQYAIENNDLLKLFENSQHEKLPKTISVFQQEKNTEAKLMGRKK